jgi:Taurine catabolism dioxygenase TauD, TfdA family
MSKPDFIKKESPFDLNNQHAYENWRDKKLENYPDKAEQLIVEINNPQKLTNAEHYAIFERYRKSNMAVYISKEGINPDKRIASNLAEQFGLKTLDRNMGADDDGITSLQVSKTEGRERYIPYSNKAIHWHTDGYYNKLDRQIHALNLHCVRPAMQGGENAVLDHEIAYIRLRDENPDYIHALSSASAMTIPANIKDNIIIRPDRSGPVFSTTENDTLHMRYTERAHSIIWNNDPVTSAAVKALESLLHSSDPYIFRLTLQAGWGLISNNILHDRSGFNDDINAPRLLYRLRYFEGLGI